MHILLFILYCGLCGFGIWKLPFFKRSGIRPRFLLSMFALHVLVGCLHNEIAWRFYPEHGDIWFYFQFSLLERHRLLHDTHLFLYYNSSWDAISHNAITFIQIILDFFSFDDMWINTLLFSFPVFLGNTALYRVFRRQFPGSPLSAATAKPFFSLFLAFSFIGSTRPVAPPSSMPHAPSSRSSSSGLPWPSSSS